MRVMNKERLKNIAEAAIRAGEPRVQFVSPKLVIAALSELEAEVECAKKALQEIKNNGCAGCGGYPQHIAEKALQAIKEVTE